MESRRPSQSFRLAFLSIAVILTSSPFVIFGQQGMDEAVTNQADSSLSVAEVTIEQPRPWTTLIGIGSSVTSDDYTSSLVQFSVMAELSRFQPSFLTSRHLNIRFGGGILSDLLSENVPIDSSQFITSDFKNYTLYQAIAEVHKPVVSFKKLEGSIYAGLGLGLGRYQETIGGSDTGTSNEIAVNILGGLQLNYGRLSVDMKAIIPSGQTGPMATFSYGYRSQGSSGAIIKPIVVVALLVLYIASTFNY